MISFIYGYNNSVSRISLWDYIKEESKNIKIPWIVASDFNAVIYDSDRKGPANKMNADSNFFNCILESGLHDPEFTGHRYTWRGGKDFFLHSKIDRVFINYELFENLSDIQINFLNHSISDHAPINIRLIGKINRNGSSPFRYNNVWHLSVGYKEIIENNINHCVNGDPLYCFIQK